MKSIALFQEQPEQMSDGASYDINHLALEDVKNYIKSQHELHIKTSMKTLMFLSRHMVL